MGALSSINSSLIRKYPLILLAVWTCLVVVSAISMIYQGRRNTLREATLEARTYFELNRSYRQWAASLGGIYAPAGKVVPNPFLTVPDRDVRTTDGRLLTMVNPAYMTKLVFDIVENSSPLPVISRITSLNCLNPSNRPDPWEKAGLLAFEKGREEEVGVTRFGGSHYLRLLKPFSTEAGCLKCHGDQGYEVGDIRGGISISVPLQPYFENERRHRNLVLASHLVLWLAVSGGLVVFSRVKLRQDAQLAESEWKFRTLSESASDWEYWMNEDRKVIYMSPSSVVITGYSPGEFASRPELLAELVHPDDRELWAGHAGDFRSAEHDELVIRIVAKDGGTRWLSHVCSPVFNNGRFLGRRFSNRDITRQHHLENQLRQAQKMEAIGTLAGGIAHDFNNILTAIIGYGGLLQLKMPEGDPQRPNVDAILSAADKASHLTRSLLAFSRKQVLNARPVDINEIVRNIGSLLVRLIGEDIDLKTELSGENLTVLADGGQLEQVLMNLATNARDAMPGGGQLTIKTERVAPDAGPSEQPSGQLPADEGTRSAGASALITVSDTGGGMEQRVLDKIFEPFFTTKEAGKGTGLGLSIVYGIVKQHNGRISAYSEPGHGTVFRIYIPLIGVLAGIPGPVDRGRPRAGTETILVAEDNADVRKLIRTVLEGFGYVVIEAADGNEAVAKMRESGEDVRLLLLDVIMPGKNGKEVLDEICALRPGIRSLFISGYTEDFIRKRGIIGDTSDFLPKPVSPNELLGKVREILDRNPAG